MKRFAAAYEYAGEVLDFGFGNDPGGPVSLPNGPEAAALERLVVRAAGAWRRSGRSRFVLLGLGSGALAAALAAELPEETLCVAELDLPLVRTLRASGRLDWFRRDGGAGLAADASSWALFFLLDRAGFRPGEAFVLPNPELPPREKARFKQLELLLARSRRAEIPSDAASPRLSCAAVLAPDEPDLPEFLRQFPEWIAELVLVWDADSPPSPCIPDRFPVRNLARRLGGDFAAQRNAMLAACRGDWVLYLDADERLSPEVWAALPRLCAAPGIAGWHFPRVSPYPAPERSVIGFGLWPDIQLRLFRRGADLRFVHPVHERLTGFGGAEQGLAPNLEIEHLSRLRKDAAAIRRKLSGFDAAAGGRLHHVLSAEYPSLPRELLAAGEDPALRGYVLPAETASVRGAA